MAELERDLRALGEAIRFPPTPPLAANVAAQLRTAPVSAPTRPSAPKRPIAGQNGPLGRRVAAGVALLGTVALAGALATAPAARELATELLGLSSVRIESGSRLEPRQPEPPRLGPEVSLRTARRATGFDVLVPDALGPPDSVHVNRRAPGDEVTLAYAARPGLPEARETGLGLLVTEVRGDLVGAYIRKLVSPRVEVERLRLFGRPAVWIAGAPHLFAYEGAAGFAEARLRLATNTLLCERGGVLVRIEAEISERRAVEVARSLRGTDRAQHR